MSTARKVAEAAEAADRFLSGKIDLHRKRMEKAIQKLEERMVTLVSRFATDASGRIKGPQYTLKQAQRIHAMMALEFERQYGRAVKSVVEDFGEVGKFVQKNLRDLSIPSEFTEVDQSLMLMLKDQTFEQFNNLAKEVQDELAQGIYSSLTAGQTTGELVTDIRGKLAGHKDAIGRPMAMYAGLFVQDSLMNYYRAIHLQKAKDAGLKHFLYYGDVIGTSRPFCIARVGRIFNQKQVEGWRHRWEGKAGPAMRYCGGFNCRHHWVAIKPEWMPDGLAEMQDYWQEQGGLPEHLAAKVAKERSLIGLAAKSEMGQAAKRRFEELLSGGTQAQKLALRQAGIRSGISSREAYEKAGLYERELEKIKTGMADPGGLVEFGKKHPYQGLELNGIEIKETPLPVFENIPDKIDEPDFDYAGALVKDKEVSAGVVIQEPDGRVWVYEPKGHFGGYEHTLAKGRLEKGFTLQQTAMKEAREELGLDVELTAVLGDYERETTVTRYYIAKRKGGDPGTAHWEALKVKLAPVTEAKALLNKKVDRDILDDFLAGVTNKVPQKKSSLADMRFVSPAHRINAKKAAAQIKGEGVALAEVTDPEDIRAVKKVMAALEKADEDALRTVRGISDEAGFLKQAQAEIPFNEQRMTPADYLEALKEKAAELEKAANTVFMGKTSYDISDPDQLKKFKTQQKKNLTSYKKSITAGKKPTKTQQDAYDLLAEADKAAVDTEVVALKEEAAGAALDRAKQRAVESDELLFSKQDWVKTGAQRGSNPGGRYRNLHTGDEYYIKWPASADMARNELLAGKLYQACGIEAPELKLVRDVNGRAGIASKIVEGVKEDRKLLTTTTVPGAQDGLAIDAWLGNWDVTGANFDNLLIKNGRAVRIDVGGSLRYRAMGGMKGKAWNKTVDEIDSLRDASVNPNSAAVFRGMSQADIEKSAARVITVSDEEIRRLVKAYGPMDAGEAEELAGTLIARKGDLEKRFPKAWDYVQKARSDIPSEDSHPVRDLAREVKKVAKARANGYSVPTDVDEIEDHVVHFWHETDLEGNLVTGAQLKIRGPAVKRVEDFIEAHKAPGVGKSPKGPRTVLDDFQGRIDTLNEEVKSTVVGILHQGNQGAVLRAKDIERLAKAKTTLKSLAGDIGKAAGEGRVAEKVWKDFTGHYQKWVDIIEEAVKGGAGTKADIKAIKAQGWFEGFKAPEIKPDKVKTKGPRIEWRLEEGSWQKKDLKNGRMTQQAGNVFLRDESAVRKAGWVTEIDGVKVRYWDSEQAMAIRHQMEVLVPGNDEAAAARVYEVLDRLGVNTASPSILESEELYLVKLLYKYSNDEAAGLKTWEKHVEDLAGIHGLKERVEYLRKALGSRLGIEDVTKVRGYNPFGEYEAFEQGRRVWRDPFVEQSSKWKKFAKDYRIIHQLHSGDVADSIDRILNSGGKMVPTLDKPRYGIPWGGLSPSADMRTGGASYFFTRIKTKAQGVKEGHLIWKAKVLTRADAITYRTDLYGRTTGRTVLENRKTGIDAFRAAARRSNNETNFKNGLSLLEDLEHIVCANQYERDKVIQVIQKHGYRAWPDGRPIEEVVTVR